jgi:hypothetical protein
MHFPICHPKNIVQDVIENVLKHMKDLNIFKNKGYSKVNIDR